MNVDTIQNIILLISAIGTIFSIYKAVRNEPVERRKTQTEIDKGVSDTAETLTDTAIRLIAPLKEELRTLRIEFDNLRNENIYLRDWVRILIKQLADAKIIPQEPQRKPPLNFLPIDRE